MDVDQTNPHDSNRGKMFHSMHDNGMAAYESTQKVLETMVQGSKFFETHPPRPIPTFQTQELELGVVIGVGEFGVVRDVLRVQDNDKPVEDLDDSQNFGDQTNDSTEKMDKPSSTTTGLTGNPFFSDGSAVDGEGMGMRARISTRCSRLGRPRYAVKRVREELDPKEKFIAIIDLAAEAKFLSRLQHTNVVRLRATAGNCGTDEFMLVLDRLYSTLEEKIQLWQANKKMSKRRFSLFSSNKDKLETLNERLVALLDIARALKYLHENRIIFRDLKPENVGVDIKGIYRIFDFGLAKELKEEALQDGTSDMYEATGRTGSQRWMAPEVFLWKNYGLSADVYSYGLMFWNVIALKTPFDNYSADKHMRTVVLKGRRPSHRRIKMPSTLRNMMVRAWSSQPSQRPSFTEVCKLIQFAICEMSINETNDRNTILDRSAYLLDQSIQSCVTGSDAFTGSEALTV